MKTLKGGFKIVSEQTKSKKYNTRFEIIILFDSCKCKYSHEEKVLGCCKCKKVFFSRCRNILFTFLISYGNCSQHREKIKHLTLEKILTMKRTGLKKVTK